ncbi:MAG: hypothetical protein ABL982_20010, partial [Vicinamibacterales bacterium]
ISTGSGNVSLTSGGNFDFLSPVKTTGSLTVTSTGGDITTSAPIDDETGAVTITAYDQLVVNRDIRTADSAISLNAGAGGLSINVLDDYDYTKTSSVNSGSANLTLTSGGNVAINDPRGIASTATITIDADGQILSGSIGDAIAQSVGRPAIVNLNADGGIVSFSTGRAGEVNATSSGGSIDLTVESPGKLRVTTGTPDTLDCPTCNIHVTSSAYDGSIGPDVAFNAGGTINMPFFRSNGTVTFTARTGDVNVSGGTTIATSFVALAGRDVLLNSIVWVGAHPSGDGSGGAFTATAGRDIVSSSNNQIHMTNGALTFVANRNLTMYLLETLKAVSLTATTGNITLNNDIGPHITNPDAPGVPDFNPLDKGVASLTMSAGGSITMQGARAEGNISITAGGNLTAAKQILSVSGTRTLTIAGTTSLNDAVTIGTQNQVEYPPAVAPIGPVGPKAPIPTAPGVASNLAAGLPPFAEISVAAANQVVGGVIVPGSANGSVGLSGAVAGVGTPAGTGASVGLPGGTGGAGAPNTNNGITGRPTAPSGAANSGATGSSDPGTADTAAALRTAGESCGEEATSDNGLAAVAPTETAAADSQQKAACVPSAASQTAAAAPAPGGAATPTTPTGSGDAPAAPPAPIGGANQQ